MSIRNIYHEMTSFNSLRVAEGEVTKGKGEKQEVLAFEDNLEDNLHDISNGLRHGRVPQVHYKSFYVYSPKVRKVIYIDYASKVIQRAAYDYLNPRLNKTFISDTYACIPGKGQHKAMLKVKSWMEETRTQPGDWYYYKFDVAKFFYRIDHETLMAMLHHKVDDRRAVELLEYYICNTSRPFGLPLCANQAEIDEEDMLWEVGIPIGGGLSHTLGNLYLDPLDQFIKRELGVEKYARYMDDGVMFDNDKHRLIENGKRAEEFVQEKLKLEFNAKTALRPARCGVEFVGCVIHDDTIRLRKSTTLRMKRRLVQIMEQYNRGEISIEKAMQTVASYEAMLKHMDMDRFKESLWADFVLTKGDLKEARSHPMLYQGEPPCLI